MSAPVRGATRRRGEDLRRAVFDAVFEELRRVGYAKLSMEGIASAADTGKAALYRRWSDRDALLVDALKDALPSPAEVVLTDDLRTDVLNLLESLRTALDATKGAAMQVVKVEGGSAGPAPSLIREHIFAPYRARMLEVLARGARRGEVRPGAVTDAVADAGPAMLIHHAVLTSPDVPAEHVRTVVDEVILPSVRP